MSDCLRYAASPATSMPSYATEATTTSPPRCAVLEKYGPKVPALLLVDRFEDGDGSKWVITTQLPGEWRAHI